LLAAIFLHIFYIESTWVFSSMHQYKNALYTINPISRISEFILGVVSAELWMRRNGNSFGFKARTVAEMCAVLMVLGMNLMTKEFGDMIGSFFSPPYKIWSQVSLVDPFFAILICVFATGGGLLTRLLSHRIMVFLGEISFAAYLIHQPVQKYIGQQLSGMPPSTLLISAILVTIALSTVAHFLIEKPVYTAFSAWLHSDSRFDKDNNVTAARDDDLTGILGPR
jgi:peptidoglycan/LPS O-acetylase OafA/YrhL